MAQVTSFKQLRTWQEAHKLVLEIYEVTKVFPKEESYGLTSQLRRAAVSIPSNIAEGMGRQSTKEFIRYNIQARGSIQEVLYQLLLCKDLGYLMDQDYTDLAFRYDGLNVGINKHINSLLEKS